MSSPEELTFVIGRWPWPIVLMLNVVCRLRGLGRHIAVNRGVRRSISDSGAIRSTGVPNVKMARDLVAFWHNARRVRLCLRHFQIVRVAAASPRQSPLPCRRSCRCATDRRSSDRRKAVDRFRCDPRTAPPQADPAADRRCRRIAPTVFHALPYNQSPLPQPANEIAAKSILW